MRRTPGSGWPYTLRAHLLVLVVGTLLPALVLATVLVRRVVEDNRAAIQRQLLEASRSEASLVDAELSGTIRALQALTESDHLTNDNLAAFYQEATRLREAQQTWVSLALHTPDGRNLFTTSRPYGDPLPDTRVQRESLDAVVQGRAPVVGNLVKSPNGWLFPVRVPVLRRGQVPYILSAVMTPDSLAKAIVQSKLVPQEWIRGTMDRNGAIVLRSRDSEQYVGRPASRPLLERLRAGMPEGIYASERLDGQPVYSGYAIAPLSKWVTVVVVPRDVVDTAFRQSMLTLGLFGLLLLGTSGAGAFLIARRIARDIAGASASASAIAGGSRPEFPYARVAEVQELTDALARSASLLEHRQAERDEQLSRADAARAEAEAADRAKDEFLAMLGHELRNPLAPVLTALQLMRLRGDIEGNREREIIERQVRHLVRLVDDLLDVSRLRRGRIELRSEPFELRRAVDKAVEISAPLVASHGHQLSVQVPASGLGVDGDETRLAQVFVNLLNNAAKYQARPGHITLTAWLNADTDMVMISCADAGVGIEASLLPHIFDLFTQGRQSLDRRGGGLGLGLAVVRTIVELHGGTIEARSDGSGRGSTFVVGLPRVPVAQSDSGPVEVLAPAVLRSCRVLVVDDNRDAAEMLAETTRLAGCEVKVALDGLEALDIMERFQADACVLDIGLPGMNGFELARRLRAINPSRRVRLIAVTGYGQQADVEASRAAGFDEHLVKPVSTEVLIEAIRAGFVA